jgi:transcriptional regulator with XRE-family HTH domain
MSNETMAAKIKALRLQKGMTLEEVANIVGVGKSTVRKWETGMIANMKRDKIASLARALGTTPAYLMGWEDVQKTNDLLADIIVRLRTDDSFSEIVQILHGLDPEKLSGIKIMLDTFLK